MHSELPHLGHLPLLEVLHLNDNKISVIHRDALSSCKLLKLVDVSFNSITDPSQLLLALQPCAASLQRISVNDNPCTLLH
jgi:Leucine-rich repeat (LRR) protein